ncbi:MAG: response regulator [Anaerolineales bacterium]|nr:response regulator [Anaerolineales bacterium]
MKKMASRRKTPPADTLYRDFFELSPVAKAVLDSGGALALVNQAFLRRFCLRREDVRGGGIPFDALFEQPESARELIGELRGERIIRRREIRMRDAEGQTLTMLVYGRTRPGDSKFAFEFSFVNITQQKTIEQALRRDRARRRALIESIGAGVFLMDREGNLTEINRAAAGWLGVPAEGMTGRSQADLFAPLIASAEEPGVVQHRLQRAASAVEGRPVVEVSRRDPPRRILEIAFFPVRDPHGARMGWGGLIQDVTEARGRLAWKVRLLSILAQDIRAPLAALKGHATALLANFRRWDDAMVQEFLEVINRRTDELVRHADRSLALTRMETDGLGLKLESVRLPELIRQAVDRASESLEGRRVTVEAPEDLPTIRADPARLEEVLVILLDNAVRYSPPEAPVRIRAEPAGEALRVSVTDQGPGIDAQRRKLLLDRTDAADPDRAGGIGLHITRKFVEAHGGRLGVESPPAGLDRGTRFFFTLPLMPPPPEAAGAAPPPPPSGEETKRVLVVEDQADYQALLLTILKRAGYEAAAAPDGPAAIDILRTSPPDLILMEWTLPGMDGLSLCRNIRRLSGVPILVLTSKLSQGDLVAALDTGADDYVTKPFQSAELLARIRSLIRRGDSLPEEGAERFEEKGLTVEYASREAWKSGRRLDLTPTEFDLLAFFSRNPGRILEYGQLMERIFGPGTVHTRHDLFVHISRLRKKIEADPKQPAFIQTRWGTGYVFLPRPRKR